MPRRCPSSSHLSVEMTTIFYSVARPSFFFHLDSHPSSPPKPSISISSLRSPFSIPPIAKRSTMKSFSILTRSSSSLSSSSSSSAALDDFNVGSFSSVTILRAANGEPVQFNDLLDEKDAKVFSRLDSMRNALKNYTISATPDDLSSDL